MAFDVAMVRLLGKRFLGLLIALTALTAGYFIGAAEKFAVFASTIGLMYGAYVGGQSFTDAKEAKGPGA